MIRIISFLFLIFTFTGCKKVIKNTDEKIIDEVSIPPKDSSELPLTLANTNLIVKNPDDILGFWIGYFQNANEDKWDKMIGADEGLSWTRENKINISIDKIEGENVIGHSVVAGNSRPFKGILKKEKDLFTFETQEPGDDAYDGKFEFNVKKNDSLLQGTWSSYKKIEIPKRNYILQKKIFKYNPEQMLEHSRRYGDWNNFINKEETYYYGDEKYSETYEEFSTSTEKIYEINASTQLLKKKDVENLKKGDLVIIRNTIYARHGYSFKNRPLRVFFDAQPWYIPVHTNIKNDLTEIEKKNIQLLLKYEKNAKEYYDTFGRG